MPQEMGHLLLALAVGLTLIPFLGMFRADRAATSGRPTAATMLAGAIHPAAFAFCFVGKSIELSGLLLIAGVFVSLAVRHVRQDAVTVAVGALSLGLYLKLSPLPV